MKAEISKNRLILSPKTKKEVKQIKKYLEFNAAEAVFPKSRKEFTYWKITDLWLIINL